MQRFEHLRTATAPLIDSPATPEPWDLAELTSIEASSLIRGDDDKVGKFFLLLALAYNDLKGLVMLEGFVRLYPRPAASAWTPYAGQWRGLHVQVVRWVAGVMHEALNAIRTEGAEVIDMAEFKAIVAAVAPGYAQSWRELVRIAKDDIKVKPTEARMLRAIRSEAGFHYLGKHLYPAFREQFIDVPAEKESTGNKLAYASLGATMKGTRFHFADAVVQQMMRSIGVSNNEATADEAVVRRAETFNEAIGVLVSAFIRTRLSQIPG